MKTFYKNTNKIFRPFVPGDPTLLLPLALILMLMLIPSNSNASGNIRPIGIVSSVTGTAFATTKGKTKELFPGAQIFDSTAIRTEEGAQISVTDYFDHKFHLAGSGHMTFMGRTITLKQGYLWVQSYNDSFDFFVKTANAVASGRKGEMVTSFDNMTGKSQFLSIEGKFNFANLFRKHLSLTLNDGQFSFIDRERNSEAPRTPTPIGFSSFEKITGLFQGIRPAKRPQRALASLPAKPVDGKRKKIPKKAAMVPKGKKVDLDAMYKEKLEAVAKARRKIRIKKMLSYRRKSGVPIKVFGQKSITSRKMPAPRPPKRKPASRHLTPDVDTNINLRDDSFERGLINQYKKQKRHSIEVNRLINELKSYDQDYKENY